MSYKRLLTIQDISCVGQCSLTVALPILSACGHETAILPSAVLSTHTSGFTGFTFRDLVEDMPAIGAHWQKEGIRFAAVYTGYLGSVGQVDYVRHIMRNTLEDGGLRIVDPAMADNGKLYPLFGQDYVEAMKALCFESDILLPNITEACYLTDMEYRAEYDESYIRDLLAALRREGAKTVVLTGVSYEPATTGVVVLEGEEITYYRHRRLPQSCHGTGDVYASAFVGALMNGISAPCAAAIAADYTVACMENTVGDPNHTYGVKFEPVLGRLIERIATEQG
jgi:pyridoxine kinase